MEDLFDYPELIPANVSAILDKYCDVDNTYENCDMLVKELEQVGYTCEFGLDAIPYNLTKVKRAYNYEDMATLAFAMHFLN